MCFASSPNERADDIAALTLVRALTHHLIETKRLTATAASRETPPVAQRGQGGAATCRLLGAARRYAALGPGSSD
jgi:hypothetical protein